MSVTGYDRDAGELAGRQAEYILVDGKNGELPVTELAYQVDMNSGDEARLFPAVEFMQFVEKVG